MKTSPQCCHAVAAVARGRIVVSTVRRAWRLLLFPLLIGCTQDMYDQPRYEPLEASKFFRDGKSARHPVEGTIARGQLWHTQAYFTGRRGGKFVSGFPDDPRPGRDFSLDLQLLQRGRERYNIFCSACHGRTGHGDGMVVQRGFPRPPRLHDDEIRNKPNGHYFEVISQGLREMPAYASSIPADDRWAIVAYVRALQTSQHLPLSEAPQDIRKQFDDAND